MNLTKQMQLSQLLDEIEELKRKCSGYMASLRIARTCIREKEAEVEKLKEEL